MCSSNDVSQIFIKWKESDVDEHEKIYNHSILNYEGDGSVVIKVDESYRWKPIWFSLSFNTSQGSAPWSEWKRISGATNSK